MLFNVLDHQWDPDGWTGFGDDKTQVLRGRSSATCRPRTSHFSNRSTVLRNATPLSTPVASPTSRSETPSSALFWEPSIRAMLASLFRGRPSCSFSPDVGRSHSTWAVIGIDTGFVVAGTGSRDLTRPPARSGKPTKSGNSPGSLESTLGRQDQGGET